MDLIRSEKKGIILFRVNLVRATLKESDKFKDMLKKDIDSGKNKFVIDLSFCEFIDSTFLGTIVLSLKKVTAIGGDIKLVGFQPAVRSMLELTRISKVFETFESTDEALRSFK
ncbi:MAG TPA: STAS domain-containing protein [Ignavibacteriaceae bacterium]|nr:STAS domain-containing protein [Ignavibacteriaceae bacterium]